MKPGCILARAAYRALCLIAFALVGSCSKPDAIHLRIINAGTAEGDRLVGLHVFAGADKSWWPELAPQEAVNVILDPGGDPPEVVMSFKLRDAEKHWRGPELEAGSGYTMIVSVAADGSIDEDHCRMPCSLR